MTETVEYQAANLTPAQRDYAGQYESEAEGNQARVSTISEKGAVTLHLHSAEGEPRTVVLDKHGEEQSG